MYKLPGQEELLFYMLYTTAAVLSLIACCYLLFRRGNAVDQDITPPVRLRRWTAAFFAAMTLSHMAYLPGIFLSSAEKGDGRDEILGYIEAINNQFDPNTLP